MKLQRLSQIRRDEIRKYLLLCIAIGTCYAAIEYLTRIETENAQLFWPLLMRANLATALIIGSISILELTVNSRVRKKSFGQIILRRSAIYTIIVVFWLVLINGIKGAVEEHTSFIIGLRHYVYDHWFIINLLTIFIIASIYIGLLQIDKLHRKGELFEFITGKYHNPREVERIFCFIDLKGSTSIAERLGHFQFSLFLQDYYSDITDAIKTSRAEVYQYVGDEIVLSWSMEKGVKDHNAIMCYFRMKKDIEAIKNKYVERYGVYPQFRAGVHGGKAIVTWVGEVKKEIVYVGDVLNTAARLQEACKRLKKDFLISEQLLARFESSDDLIKTFEEEMVPRGKKESIGVYSIQATD